LDGETINERKEEERYREVKKQTPGRDKKKNDGIIDRWMIDYETVFETIIRGTVKEK